MIIETTDNRFYRVEETGVKEFDHLWYGRQVKRVHGKFVLTAKATRALSPELVRKEVSRVVEA